MNEITRIHIAKIAYDVDVTAKKHLEKYIKSLETYTHDTEVLGDIEIRMTELLDERGVKAGGVITNDDVTAIREQLGEPYEFADEDGDIAVGDGEIRDGRKFYRNLDDAVLGGVLGGIAVYFKVNPLWPRLMFILLTFITFGTALLAYALFWIIVPPARTATQKLRQSGRPVTLSSIRELNELGETAVTNRTAPIVKKVASVTLGTVSLLGAIGALALTIFGTFGALGMDITHLAQQFGFVGVDNTTAFSAWVVVGIVILGMVLLIALLSLVAYAFFAQKLTRRMLVSGIVIIALGLASLAASVGVATTQAWWVSSDAQRLVKTTKVTLSKDFANVKSVIIDETDAKNGVNTYGSYPLIRYVVDQGAPRYELSALPGVSPVITVDGETARISLAVPNDYRNAFIQVQLVIYGPALTTMTNNAFGVSYTTATQSTLEIFSKRRSTLTLDGGSIDSVIVNGTGSVNLGATSTASLTVKS